MTDFYVPAPSYKPVDWSWLADLPNQYYQGQANADNLDKLKQQAALRHMFDHGVPTNSDGSVDAAKLLQMYGMHGDVQDVPQLSAMAQQQQQLATARQLLRQGASGATPNPVQAQPGSWTSPLPQQASAGAGGTPTDSAPPASAATARSTVPSAGSSNSANASGGASVGQLVSQMLPSNGKTGDITQNLARYLHVDPTASLTPDQQAQVRSALQAYAGRNGIELPGDGLLTRGLRNDNPANISDGTFAQSQPGYTGPEAQGRFATFGSEQAGLNAAAALIGRYGSEGINTISGIVNKWAPSSDGNNTAAYTSFVASKLGINPNRPLDLSNPQTKQAIAQVMSQYESGGRGGATNATASGQSPSLVPQYALPKGASSPQEAISMLDQAMLGADPNIAEPLKDMRDRFASQVTPMEVKAGEALVDPATRQVIYQAPGTNPTGMLVQDFIAEHPDATAEQIQDFLQSGKSGGRSAISMYMHRFLEENPDASADDVKRAAQQYTTQTTAQNRFLSGPQGNTIRSLNVVVSHLQTMQDLGDALNNGNITLFNSVAQEFAAQTGSPAPTSFDTAKQIVGAEIIKALGVAGAGTQSERQEAADAFNKARSPQQLSGAIEVARNLLVGQLQGLRRQYVASTGLPGGSFDDMLEPGTKAFFSQGGGQGATDNQGQSGQPTQVSTKAQYDALPSGTQYVAPDGSLRTKS